MFKIKFYLDSGYVGGKREEIVEFEDGTTEDEITKVYTEWIAEYGGWYEVDDD